MSSGRKDRQPDRAVPGPDHACRGPAAPRGRGGPPRRRYRDHVDDLADGQVLPEEAICSDSRDRRVGTAPVGASSRPVKPVPFARLFGDAVVDRRYVRYVFDACRIALHEQDEHQAQNERSKAGVQRPHGISTLVQALTQHPWLSCHGHASGPGRSCSCRSSGSEHLGRATEQLSARARGSRSSRSAARAHPELDDESKLGQYRRLDPLDPQCGIVSHQPECWTDVHRPQATAVGVLSRPPWRRT